MPKVELFYFPFKSLGEGIRMLLAYGAQDFEDYRIDNVDWPKYKSQMKFGQIPVLKIDGKQYTQSVAICRYLGKKYGVAGADIEEDFEIDQHIDFINDIRAKAASVHYESNEAIKEARHKDYTKNVYPELLEKLNEIISENNGHVACGKLTWGDFFFAGYFLYLKMMLRMPNLEKKYPNFQKVVDNVYSIPRVKAWADAAPEAEF